MAFAFSKSRSAGEMSRNASTPPMISPAALRIGATVTCTGVRRPSFRLANTSGAPLPTPVTIERCRGQYSLPQSSWPSLSTWESRLSKQ